MATSPANLKKIAAAVKMGTEKELPFSQGYAINELIKRYKIKAVAWGYSGSYIGLETTKQKIFWKDKGSELVFMGIINKDGSVSESRKLQILRKIIKEELLKIKK